MKQFTTPSETRFSAPTQWLRSSLLLLVGLVFSVAIFAQATVTTDKPDYAPRSNAVFTGAGFQPGEEVILKVKNISHPCNTIAPDSSYTPWSVFADVNGGFVSNWTVCDCLGDSLKLKASGQTSGYVAYALFSDGDGTGSMTVNPSGVCASSQNNSFAFSFRTANGSQGDYAANSQATIVIPAGWTVPQTALGPLQPGYVSVATVGSATSANITSISGLGPWTITVTFATPRGTSNGFNLTYGGGGTQVTAPSAGSYTFTTQTKNGTSGTLTSLTPANNQPTITVNALPNATVSTVVNTCSNTTDYVASVPSAGSGATYSWSIINGTITAGIGSNSITYSAGSSGSLTLSVTVTNNSGCQSFSGNTVIPINPLPLDFTIGYSGSLCTSPEINLDGSQIGVTYQLLRNGSGASLPLIPGTGSAISFGNFSQTGTYTVLASNSTSGCIKTMTGNVNITGGTPPASFDVTGGGFYCTGGSGVPVGLSGSETGATYQLFLDNVSIGSSVNGTGSAISFGNQTSAGTYTAVATKTSGNCMATMTGSASVSLNSAPAFTTSPASQTVTYGASSVTFTAAANGTPSPTFKWQINTGSGFSDISGQNSTTLIISSPTVSMSGYQYRAVATNTCTAVNSTPAILTVDPKALTITANSTSKTYGQTVTFTGAEFTSSGLVNSDAVTSVTLTSTGAAAGAGVGSYPIVASAAVGTGLGNYTISYVDGTLTVDPKALTITANSTSKTYGQTVTFTGAEFTSSGLVNSDAVTSVTLTSTGAAAGAGVGSYPIVASAAVGTGLGNYTISYVDGTLTVDPKALTITANSTSKTYGQTVTFTGAEFTSSGLVNSDAVTSVTLTSTGAAAGAGVGSYPIVASAAVGTGLGNYTISYVDGTLTVDPKALTITANSTSKTYGQTVTFTGAEFTSSGLVNSDAVTSVTLTSTGAAAGAGVGSYPIVASAAVGTGLGNYTISYVDGTLTVDPKALTITANSTSKTYGQTVTFTGAEFTSSGLVNSDAVTSVTLTSTGAAAGAGVGSYPIVASAAVGTGLGNYTISYVDGTLTVDPKALTITANSTSKTYGQTVTFTGAEFTSSGLVNSDAVTSVTLTSTGAAAGAGVGSYPIVASAAVGTGLGNYTISYVDGTLTVDPKALTITANSTSKTYGQTVTFTGAEFTSSGLVNSDAVTSVTLTSTGAAAGAGVGSYPIVASAAVGTGLGNYTISYVDGTLTVDPKALTITANSTSKTYGQTVTFTGAEFTSSGLVNSDAVTSVTLTSTGAAAGAGVGSYPIVASAAVGTGLGNYTISYVDGTLTVDPKALTITANSTSKTYGQTVTFTGAEFTSSGLVNSDAVTSVTLTSTGAAAGAGVGSYPIVASAAVGTGLGNYTISYVDGTLTVDPKALTITANSTSKTYGQTVTFTGAEFTSSGLVNSDAVTSVTLTSTGAAAGAGVGSYPIVASAAVGTGLGNYTISYVDGTLTVDPKALTITANSTSKTYGQTVTFTGAEFTSSGLVNSDAVTSVTLTSTGAAAGAGVGSYPIVASAAVGTGLGNYTISYVDGTLTVDPKALTITANSTSKTYGQTVTFTGAEFTSSGLVNSDAVTSVTLTSTGAAAGAGVGSYPIVASAAVGTGLGNYTISYVDGTLTVDPKALTITALDASKYCGQTVTFTGAEFTSSGLVNSDAVTSVTLTSTGAAAGAGVGSYPIVASAAVGTGLGNYTISYVGGTLTINGVTIDANASSTPVQKGSPATLVAIVPGTNGVAVTFKVYAEGDAINPIFTSAPVTTSTQLVNNVSTVGVATTTILSSYIANVGVYKVIATAGSSCATSTVFFPVFDPTESFVTGGGWINSPIYTAADYMQVEGKANFGFVSKYKKGSTQVDGNTEFQFQAGNLNFKSTMHESGSLVISGGKATYRGTGTVNNMSGYKFVVVAIDGDWNGGTDADRFRIKITRTSDNKVVYDNQYGKDENTADATILGNNGTGGGSIVIHEVKATGKKAAIVDYAKAETLEVKTANNPSLTGQAFVLQFKSDDTKAPITLKVVDVNGKAVEMKQQILPGSTVEIGRSYTSGLYIAEAIQNNKRVVIKLMKQ